ncbi:uncharacterized protein [Arachis hypogaea]|uniref:uncharacterized protein n=1 Tax=Arachis hypogaea TaxID=3818 RepID=UPI000DEC3286|nr:uncharacterized protein LOC112715401 [Arachis hypogaea]
MHIEKNVCDNVLYTLLNETGRSKDNLKARKDLKEMGIRKDLWPDENGRYHPSLFTMSNSMKDVFLRTIKNIRVLDGLSSNISRCVDLKQRKLSGLKSHDCHVLMQQLLPIAIRNVLPDKVTAVLIELSSFFQQLCSKSLSLIELEKLQPRIILTLCHLEMLFPPSFFTIMVHLTCHLVDEAKLGGPVHYRWMYPIERYLGHLKSYVRNKAKSEGSIAEGYVAEEALTFCSRYLEGIETRFNRPPRVDDRPDGNYNKHVDSLFPQMGNSKGAFTVFELLPMEKKQAHRYVVLNCLYVKPFIDDFKDFIRRRSKGRRPSNVEIEKRVNKDFFTWFPTQLMNPDVMNIVHEDLRYLARGPSRYAKRFSTVSINGFSFRTTNRFLLQSLGKKWREHRIKLWNDFDDPRLSKNEIINNAPEDIAPDQWALFVEYRLKPETQKLCKRNQEIRQKQIIPHTSGAKSIARRRAELTEETGKEVNRVQMWDITHKKINGSYVNEKAKEIAEKIEAHSSQQPMELTVNSPLDALGVVFGKEHPGRVRGLGMGAVPTIAFKNNTTRISQMNLGSSNDVGTSSTCGPNVQEELDSVKAQLQALVSYIASKEGGKIPIQLAGMFPTQQVSQGLDQESEIPSPKELGSRSSRASNKEA